MADLLTIGPSTVLEFRMDASQVFCGLDMGKYRDGCLDPCHLPFVWLVRQPPHDVVPSLLHMPSRDALWPIDFLKPYLQRIHVTYNNLKSGSEIQYRGSMRNYKTILFVAP